MSTTRQTNGNLQSFINRTAGILDPYTKRKGSVMYSHPITFRWNPVLFYGINPGYDPTKAAHLLITWEIGESLHYFAQGFEDRLEREKNALKKLGHDLSEPLPSRERLHANCNFV